MESDKALKKGLRAGDIVDTVYKRISSLIIEFDLRPGERVNEVKLASYLAVSRAPLREALNRLYAQGMLDFRPNRGFYVKEFDAGEILQLFEARQLLECGVARLAIENATDADLADLRGFWDGIMARYEQEDADGLVAADAEFHERMAGLTGNRIVVDQLVWINKRIQFVRWARLKGPQRYETFAEHYHILDALTARDAERAVALIQSHIDHRSRDIERAMADGLLHIYSKKAIRIG